MRNELKIIIRDMGEGQISIGIEEIGERDDVMLGLASTGFKAILSAAGYSTEEVMQLLKKEKDLN